MSIPFFRGEDMEARFAAHQEQQARETRMKPEQREAFEATDDALMDLRGLIAALDVVEDSLQPEINDLKIPASIAFFALQKMVRSKLAEVFDLRKDEWKSIGGRRP